MTAPMLTVTARQSPDTLVLTCRVSNRSGTDYGLFARIPETFADGSLKLSPHTAYIAVADGVLVVGKYFLPIPEGLKVAERHIPLAVLIPNGSNWEEQIVLPIPVRVCQPYTRALLAGTSPGADVNPEQPKLVRMVRVVLGAFPITPEVILTPVSPAFPTVFEVWPPAVADLQVLLDWELPTPSEVMVLDYGIQRPK